MKCNLKHRDELITAYLSGELSDEEALKLEEHYFECEDCFKELKAAEDAINLIEREGASILKMDLSSVVNLIEAKEKKLLQFSHTTIWTFGITAVAIIAFILILVLPSGNAKKNAGDNISAFSKDTAKTISKPNSNLSQTNKETAELSGPNFTPDPYLEEWMSENTRSTARLIDTVFSPQKAEKFFDKDITFRWRMQEQASKKSGREVFTLKILDNSENEIFNFKPSNVRFPNFFVSIAPKIFGHSGLYYWRIEDKNDVLYLGKFYFLK
jgi:Putative zinc-finger